MEIIFRGALHLSMNTESFDAGRSHSGSAISAGDQNVVMRRAGFASDEGSVMRISLLCEADFRRKKPE